MSQERSLYTKQAEPRYEARSPLEKQGLLSKLEAAGSDGRLLPAALATTWPQLSSLPAATR